MANRIKGITIEIEGNTTKLSSALKNVDKDLKTTQNNLKDIDKLLKLDPKNTELLAQKQKNLERAIGDTKTRLNELKEAQNGVSKGSAEWDALQREIIETEQNLQGLEKEYREFGSVASQQMKVAGEKMQEVGGKITDVGEKLMPVSMAAAGLGAGLVKLGYDAITGADDLNTLSKQTGISTDELQKFQYASDLVDVSLDDMTSALRKMKSKMDPTNETFAKLGVSVTNADGSLRSATDVFYETIAALGNVANETERDQLAMDLFGKGADTLAGIIDDGGASLKSYGEEAESLGLILSEDTLAKLNDTNDTFDKLKATVSASLGQVGADVADVLSPALEKVGEWVTTISEKLRELTPEQMETILQITAVVAALAPVIIIIGKVVSGIGSVINVLSSVVGALGGPVTLAITAAIAIGVLLYKNWDKICEWANTLKEKVTEAWESIKTNVNERVEAVKTFVTEKWEAIKNGVTERVEKIKSGLSTAWDAIKSTATEKTEALKGMLQGKWDAIKNAYDQNGGGLKGIANATMEGIKQYFTLGYDTLNTLTNGKLDEIRNKFTEKLNAAKETVNTIMENIRSKFEEKINAAKNVISTVIDGIKNLFNFSWSFPPLKLPHFSVSGHFSLNPPSVPHLNIDWYRKAYDNAVLFTQPTVLGTGSGLKGFGDGAGAELVIGLNKLREVIGANQNGGNVINIYQQPGQSAQELATEIDRILTFRANQQRAVWA